MKPIEKMAVKAAIIVCAMAGFTAMLVPLFVGRENLENFPGASSLISAIVFLFAALDLVESYGECCNKA